MTKIKYQCTYVLAQAVGQISRVPYLSISKREMSVLLHGTDIKFKEAKFYKRCELESLIENQASITFQGKICIHIPGTTDYQMVLSFDNE